MAMGLWRSRVAGDLPAWRVESAGIWALQGYPAAEKARLVLQARGLDISDHRAASVTPDLLAQFDLALTMEARHKQALQEAFPQLAKRVYLLTEMVGRTDDIEDPIGGPVSECEELARELEGIFARGEARIRSLAAGSEAR